jgi:hypothetical protein
MRKHKAKVALGLVHWPVLDRAGDQVCTNITNFDIHDIARACRSYGVDTYYLINRLNEQQMFAERVLDHWKTGYGLKYNPMRATALHNVKVTGTLSAAIEDFAPNAQVIATAARDIDDLPNIKFKETREKLQNGEDTPIFLVFGTGFGLHPEAFKSCTHLLEPIRGGSEDDYRHLSVRSAVSICLDRLFGV